MGVAARLLQPVPGLGVELRERLGVGVARSSSPSSSGLEDSSVRSSVEACGADSRLGAAAAAAALVSPV